MKTTHTKTTLNWILESLKKKNSVYVREVVLTILSCQLVQGWLRCTQQQWAGLFIITSKLWNLS